MASRKKPQRRRRQRIGEPKRVRTAAEAEGRRRGVVPAHLPRRHGRRAAHAADPDRANGRRVRLAIAVPAHDSVPALFANDLARLYATTQMQPCRSGHARDDGRHVRASGPREAAARRRRAVGRDACALARRGHDVPARCGAPTPRARSRCRGRELHDARRPRARQRCAMDSASRASARRDSRTSITSAWACS
jgi:hypothetical protein